MAEFVLITRLRDGMEDAYEDAHAHQPSAMTDELRAAGVRSWRIWRIDRNLVHLVVADDISDMVDHLRASAVNREWEESMATYLEPGTPWMPAALASKFVWELPATP